MTALRSAIFALALLVITPPYALLALATFALPRRLRYRIIAGWSRSWANNPRLLQTYACPVLLLYWL